MPPIMVLCAHITMAHNDGGTAMTISMPAANPPPAKKVSELIYPSLITVMHPVVQNGSQEHGIRGASHELETRNKSARAAFNGRLEVGEQKLICRVVGPRPIRAAATARQDAQRPGQKSVETTVRILAVDRT